MSSPSKLRPNGLGQIDPVPRDPGIWPFVQGTAPGERCLFLPQRPYIPLGTLRHVITYPKAAEEHSDAEVKQVLQDAGLPGLVDQLDLDRNWPQVLSGGEQQRVALARALLAKPDWLFLDEATASLDRVSMAEFHDRKLVLRREVDRPGRLFSETVGAVAAD